jgi:hypothetical protein
MHLTQPCLVDLEKCLCFHTQLLMAAFMLLLLLLLAG